MSNNNNEHRELTAAELDLAVGAAIFMKVDGIDGVIAPDKDVTNGLSWGASRGVACDGIGAWIS
jgi:hypothetical protein